MLWAIFKAKTESAVWFRFYVFLKSFFFQFKFTPLSFAKGAEMLEINSSKPWQIRSNHSAWLYNLRGRWGNMKAQPASPSGCICMFLKKKEKSILMLRQTTARRLLSPGFCSSTFTIVVTVIVGVTGIKHIVTIMYISQLDNFAGCYLQWGFAPFLSQRWRSMIIAPDTKTLEWSSGFLFFTMGVEKKPVLDASQTLHWVVMVALEKVTI